MSAMGRNSPASPAYAENNLLLLSDGNIYTTQLDGADKTYLTSDSAGVSDHLAAWSYDCSAIVYVRQEPDGSAHIWKMNADGSDNVELANGTAPTFSPDGKSILFTAAVGADRSELWLMNADGTDPHPLTDTTGSTTTRWGTTLTSSADGAFSPDGKKIAYFSTQGGNAEIWIMNADGSDQRQVTFAGDPNAPDANAPAWSPDGSKIVFWSGFLRAAGNIYTVNADGTARTQLTNVDVTSGFNADDPYWTTDGKHILFDTNETGSITTDMMNPDGSNEQQLIAQPLNDNRRPLSGNDTVALPNDDYRDTYSDTSKPLGQLAESGTATGTIETVGDKDVFAITLTAGTRYAFNLDGYDVSSSYTLRDPYLRLLDSNGNVLAADDDIANGNWGSEIDYTAAAAGTYYLEASSSPSDATYLTGSYQIRSSTPTPLGVGATETGSIDYVGDKNVYEVQLTAGTHYTFNLDGYDTSSSDSLRDPYLRLLDDNGNVLAVNDDIGSGNWSSQIDYTAATGGTYYLEAASSPSDGTYTTGSYQIRSSVAAPPAAAADNVSQVDVVPVGGGNATYTAGTSLELFDFTNLDFGNDTIVGFDPAFDTIQLPKSLAADFGSLKSQLSSTPAGTLLTLDGARSITLRGIAPATLTAAAFRFV